MHPRRVTPIGFISSVYKEKFGTPRQSGVVSSALASLHFVSPYDTSDAFHGLSNFSHIWILGNFHLIESFKFKAKVRPPKLGGKEKVGVYATRSPFRENCISLTLGKIESVVTENSKTSLIVSGIDLVDKTPIYDIKPYIPYADNASHPKSGFAQPYSKGLLVIPLKAEVFAPLSPQDIELITQTVKAHPEPSYCNPEKLYKMSLKNFTVCWQRLEDRILIIDVKENIDI